LPAVVATNSPAHNPHEEQLSQIPRVIQTERTPAHYLTAATHSHVHQGRSTERRDITTFAAERRRAPFGTSGAAIRSRASQVAGAHARSGADRRAAPERSAWSDYPHLSADVRSHSSRAWCQMVGDEQLGLGVVGVGIVIVFVVEVQLVGPTASTWTTLRPGGADAR
jgi:hypothetical protein